MNRLPYFGQPASRDDVWSGTWLLVLVKTIRLEDVDCCLLELMPNDLSVLESFLFLEDLHLIVAFRIRYAYSHCLAD